MYTNSVHYFDAFLRGGVQPYIDSTNTIIIIVPTDVNMT